MLLGYFYSTQTISDTIRRISADKGGLAGTIITNEELLGRVSSFAVCLIVCLR